MLSLLEQSHDLPEQHFLSVAMFYNDSSEAQSFQASADFLTVPEDGTDLEELHPGHAPSAPFLSHTLPALCDLTPPSPFPPEIHTDGSASLKIAPRVSSPGMASSVLPLVSTGYHEVHAAAVFASLTM
jgi:hypothetical protein